MDMKSLTTGIVLALISVFVGYTLFNSLYTPTNTAVLALNTTIYGAGYTSEAGLVLQSWKLYLIAIPLALLAGSIAFIIKAFRD